MYRQRVFERTREGTDGKLYDHNTLKRCLEVLLSGEVAEAIRELELLQQAEILEPDNKKKLNEVKLKLKSELIDIQCILASVFVHAGLTALDVERMVEETVANMENKYAEENFRGRTVAEGVEYSRDKHAGRLPEQLIERRRANGHPMPGSRTIFDASEEYEDLASSQGAIA